MTLLEKYAAKLSNEMEDCWRFQSYVSNERVRLTYGHTSVHLTGEDGRTIDSEVATDLHDAIRTLHARVSARFNAAPPLNAR